MSKTDRLCHFVRDIGDVVLENSHDAGDIAPMDCAVQKTFVKTEAIGNSVEASVGDCDRNDAIKHVNQGN